MVHYFLCDYGNSGNYYCIGIICDSKVVAGEYLRQYSKDVRYHESGAIKNKKITTIRRIPIGTICYCKFICDKYQTSSKNYYSHLAPDQRHTEVLDA